MKIEELADVIWREHYIPIVGKPQIDYMLENFQSEEAIKDQIANGFEYFLLKYNQKHVGYISVKREEYALFLSKIYVLSAYRGLKIGKAAMHFVEKKAQNYQLEQVRLTVNKYNKKAIEAYKKLGFKNIGPLVTEIGNGFIMDDYQLVKSV
ncbi:GNAT family N-acetyltransferase [Flavobacteriaceae bacterium GSB9]|nr:GNAT family N-acetyltransferase [Flavobacteriaceae bacterium GSB9]